ncbi:hypothetical protein [Spirosoma endophyticum]|uniref:hypothetical protein n=1 Tax=Spirosoma endophyticum TaxID=662367 RepID=UPI0015A54B63|nr:hypothetical protein [Spirosoma endophyticum]
MLAQTQTDLISTSYTGTSRYHVFLGVQAGNSASNTGDYNTFTCYQAGRATTTGNNNTVMGYGNVLRSQLRKV